MDERLYAIVDYILNQALDQDVDVILKAVKRRYDRQQAPGAMGVKPGQMARETAHQISEQMGYSQNMVRDMVKKLARDTIAKNAPELSGDQIEELLDAWVPDPGAPGAQQNSSGPPLPRDALLTMVRQFISYSRGSMSATEQMHLEAEVPGWATAYWKRFPADLRRILALYLKDMISDEDFQSGFTEILGSQG
jgi:hypothetical protein